MPTPSSPNIAASRTHAPSTSSTRNRRPIMGSKKLPPESPDKKLELKGSAPLAKKPSGPSGSDMVRLSKNLANLAEHGGLIMTTPVTAKTIELLCLAVDDLTGDQHENGLKNLVRYAQ